jgi:hypothetical protein
MIEEPTRDAKGRYVPGHTGTGGVQPGSGRPPGNRREAILRMMSGEAWESIVSSAIEQAAAGSIKHTEWLFDNVYGRQSTSIDVTANVSATPTGRMSDSDIRERIVQLEQRRLAAGDAGEAIPEPDAESEGDAAGLQAVFDFTTVGLNESDEDDE